MTAAGKRAAVARLAAAWLVVLASGPLDAGELRRTDPVHRPPPPGDRLPPPTAKPPWQPFRDQVVLRDLKTPWRRAGKHQPALSAACARGRFREGAPMRFRAIYQDALLGVAFGHGLNLRDPDRMADPRMIYLFKDANSTGCRVLATPNPDPELERRLAQPPAAQP